MPRPGPRRGQIGLRLSDEQRDLVAARAASAGLVRGNGEANLSEQIRHDIDRANTPRAWSDAETDIWTRINRAPDEERIAALREAASNLIRTLAAVDDAIRQNETTE